jgi:hypothetical protein
LCANSFALVLLPTEKQKRKAKRKRMSLTAQTAKSAYSSSATKKVIAEEATERQLF